MLLSADPERRSAPSTTGSTTLQFQSLSFNPKNPATDVLGGTQDNGTWSFDGLAGRGSRRSAATAASRASTPATRVRYHNYFDATPEVNFHGNDPDTWLDIYDPLQTTDEARSFYTPFVADPMTPGRLFTGLEHVWRTDDNGGNEQALIATVPATRCDPTRARRRAATGRRWART